MDENSFSCARADVFKDLILKRQPSSRQIHDSMIWLSNTWRLFFEKLGTWVAMSSIMTFISSIGVLLIYYFIPQWQINQLWQSLIACCFIGGLITSTASYAEKDDLKLSYLFSGFQFKFLQLFTLYLLTLVILAIPFSILYFYMPELLSMDTQSLLTSPAVWCAGFVMILLFLMILWFAPALIVLHDVSPWTALKMSIIASTNNILTMFIICGLISALGYILYQYVPPLIPTLIRYLTLEGSIVLGILCSNLVTIFFAILLYVSYRNVWTNLEM